MPGFSKEKFKEIQEKENIIKIVHRHWFNIATQFVVILIMAVFLVLASAFLPEFVPALKERNLGKLILFGENVIAIFIWMYAFFIWIDYYFDIWIITDERIINIEQKGLFVRSMSEVKYSRIQDVTAEEKGVIPTMLDYGDVFIQTAAETERFVFRQVPNPYELKDMIMNMQKEQIKEEGNELGEMVRKEIHEELT
ncbi:MAG: PH domain-containing protein [Patescibacteria group bacterium]